MAPTPGKPTKPKAPKKTDDMKAKAFNTLATKRMGKALKAIRNLGNLANPSSYKHTAEQVTKMRTALENEVHAAIKRYETDGKAELPGFQF